MTGTIKIHLTEGLSAFEFEGLAQIAAAEHKPVDAVILDAVREKIASRRLPLPPTPPAATWVPAA